MPGAASSPAKESWRPANPSREPSSYIEITLKEGTILSRPPRSSPVTEPRVAEGTSGRRARSSTPGLGARKREGQDEGTPVTSTVEPSPEPRKGSAVNTWLVTMGLGDGWGEWFGYGQIVVESKR
ncbi:hypothetical protein J5N97_006790 [Dioscorea zingiberensis]|uniref:Uncharacterized protein n=1 Tax=Dioscorea zingiberensis TaxID=325984 RepID=A0A9D5DC03_9LILI|nr:hypothetical protein J5N97_006790 [Dioscorea zingiberensis]